VDSASSAFRSATYARLTVGALAVIVEGTLGSVERFLAVSSSAGA